MIVTELAWALLTGLAGSLHCFGMCGPLVIAYSLRLGQVTPDVANGGARKASSGTMIYHHVAFQGGRIAAYALSGLIAAGLVHMVGSIDSFRAARSVIAIAAGCLMTAFSLILLKAISIPSTNRWGIFARGRCKAEASGAPPRQSLAGRIVASLLKSRSGTSRWALGFAAGFLPCMLSWAMVVKAAATGEPTTAVALMIFFGLGTAPALLLTGFFASFLTVGMRLAGERVAALSVLVMGLILVWKGVSHFG
jgi:uncharacterized protein